MSSLPEQHRMTSFDGTEIAYYTSGNVDGPPVVVSAGLGGGLVAWRHVLADLAPDHRLICWDYRGLFASSRAPSRRSYEIEHHARDLKCLLEHLSIEDPVLLGWSMGVQVNFEACLAGWAKPRGVVAVHGTSGSPLETAFDSAIPKLISPKLFDFVRKTWQIAMKPAPRLARSERVIRGFMALLCRWGWMDEGMGLRDFQDMACDWVELDLEAYSDIFEALGRHDCSDRLEEITAPTLVIAGGKDKFTPMHTSEKIRGLLPNAEMVVVPNATHFGLMEHPQMECEAVRSFIESL